MITGDWRSRRVRVFCCRGVDQYVLWPPNEHGYRSSHENLLPTPLHENKSSDVVEMGNWRQITRFRLPFKRYATKGGSILSANLILSTCSSQSWQTFGFCGNIRMQRTGCFDAFACRKTSIAGLDTSQSQFHAERLLVSIRCRFGLGQGYSVSHSSACWLSISWKFVYIFA